MRRMMVVLGVLSILAVGVLVPVGASAAPDGPAPRRVEAIPGDGVVTLSWSPPRGIDDPVTAYRIHRDGRVVAEVTDLSAPVFTDTGLTNGDRHRYQVSAVTDAGHGAPSRPAAVTIGPRPEDPAGTSNGSAEGGTERRTYSYSIATRGAISADLQHFAIHVAQTLNDPRGWALGGTLEFRQVGSGGDFTVWLAEASTLPSFGYPCSSSWSCRVGRNVIINQTRWQSASPSWNAAGASLDNYRHYVVNHETGHWLGFGHSYCPGGGQAAPVMQQQSKDLQGCRHNVWPVPGERSSAGSRHGVGVRSQGPAIQHSSFGRRGDKYLVCDWNGDGIETPGLIRGNEWRIRNSLSSGGPHKTFTFGKATDRFVCGDWDGNGTETAGLVRGTEWRLRNSNTTGPARITFRFGDERHRPLVGDWNGDGIDTAGRIGGNVWRLRNRNVTGPPTIQFAYGRASDRAVVGDWDGNGRSDPGLVRRDLWLLRRTLAGGDPDLRVSFGNRGIQPIAGRWVGLANDLPGRAVNGRWHYGRFAPSP